MADSYVINVFSMNLGVRITMNDCTVFRASTPSDRTEQYDLSSWVLHEEPSRLQVELALLPASAKLLGTGKRFFKIHLHKRDPGRELSVHTIMTGFRWTENESQLDPKGEPRIAFSHDWTVHPDDTYGRWSWQDAEPFDEKRDRDAVGALVQRIHSGLVTRHMGMLHTIFDTRYKELARAEETTFSEVKGRSEKFFEPFFAADDWHVQALDLAKLRYVVEGNGRLVRAFTADDTPALVGSGGGTACVQDIAMANLDGAWVAVR